MQANYALFRDTYIYEWINKKQGGRKVWGTVWCAGNVLLTQGDYVLYNYLILYFRYFFSMYKLMDTDNYITSLKEIKDDLNKWEDITVDKKI